MSSELMFEVTFILQLYYQLTNELGTEGADTTIFKAALQSLSLHGLALKDLCTPHCADTI